MQIFNGQPHSPYLVFIKKVDFQIDNLLDQLGLSDYVELKRTKFSDQCIYIGQDAQWTHLVDDGYIHWYSKDYRMNIERIAKSADIFSFSVGDVDMSFDLSLWRNGVLVRHFEWEDPYYDGGNMKMEFGDPIDGESEIPLGSDPLKALWGVAKLLGIENDYTKLDLRIFAQRNGVMQRLRYKR